MRTDFRPTMGRVAAMLDAFQITVGTIVASATTDFLSPIASPKIIPLRAAVAAITRAAGGAAITGVLVRRDALGVTNGGTPVDVPLTNTIDLTAGGLTAAYRSFPLVFLSTLTEAQYTLQAGDSLIFRVVCAGTVTTQPVGCSCAVEAAIIN